MLAATRSKHADTVVVALGGNAILQPGQLGTFEEQLVNVDAAMRRIAELVEAGWRVVLTHGNGPQVGNLLIQNALAEKAVAPMPMDVCGAESQGQIGYMLEQSLLNHLGKRRLAVPVVTVLTQVAVDPRDRAFGHPSKPVGPFYSEDQAQTMMLEQGLTMREDAGRGWRRVVPSPEPREIVPRQAIVDMVADGILVICSGGGGVPVVRARGGALSGVDAVIDKDLAAALLAQEVGADVLLILTDVPRAYINYNTPEQQALGTVTRAEMTAYAAAGHFKAGSMGPKVAACLRFVEGGGVAVIGSLIEVVPALAGEAGTRIVPDKKRAGRGQAQSAGGAGRRTAGGGRRSAGGGS
jgi:carbamate kinase